MQRTERHAATSAQLVCRVPDQGGRHVGRHLRPLPRRGALQLQAVGGGHPEAPHRENHRDWFITGYTRWLKQSTGSVHAEAERATFAANRGGQPWERRPEARDCNTSCATSCGFSADEEKAVEPPARRGRRRPPPGARTPVGGARACCCAADDGGGGHSAATAGANGTDGRGGRDRTTPANRVAAATPADADAALPRGARGGGGASRGQTSWTSRSASSACSS